MTTNNRMELTAAIEALEALKTPSDVELYTDSNYLRGGITSWIKGLEAKRLAHRRQEAGQECRAMAAARTSRSAPSRATGIGSKAMSATTRTSAPTSWPAKAWRRFWSQG